MNFNKFKKKISLNSAFTLVELMVVVSIIGIISISLFEPYNYYQNKAKLTLGAKDISQSLYDARNMAINGISLSGSLGSNSLVGLLLDSSDKGKNKITFLSYKYNINTGSIILDGNNIFKTLLLQPGIEVDKIGGKDNMLFLFDAISGNTSVLTFDENGGNPVLFNSLNKIDINISFKNSTSSSLQKQLYYYTKTNVVDY